MATDDSKRPSARRKPREPAIVEIEAAELRTIAHHALNAVELTVVDPSGRGFRTWIGADLAPSAALRFCAAVVRLIGGDPT
jgi:hypothetical protein